MIKYLDRTVYADMDGNPLMFGDLVTCPLAGCEGYRGEFTVYHTQFAGYAALCEIRDYSMVSKGETKRPEGERPYVLWYAQLHQLQVVPGHGGKAEAKKHVMGLDPEDFHWAEHKAFFAERCNR
jgi:hypothetical protein